MLEEDRVVVITGSSKGIGKHIAAAFVLQGWKVYGINRSECATSCDCLCADLATDEGIETSAAYVKDVRPHVLINNAGTNKIQMVGAISSDTVDALFRLNQKAPLILSSAAIGQDNSRLYSIVNIGSIWGQIGCKGRTVYGMTKAAVSSMSRHMACELKESGVIVNTIAPGFVNTELTAKSEGDLELEQYKNRAGPKKIMDPAEIVETCLFLSSKRVCAINGQTIIVDGGVTYG